MNSGILRKIIVFTVLAFTIFLSACSSDNTDSENVSAESELVTKLEYCFSAEEVSNLTNIYPNLEYIDFQDSCCYQEILVFCSAHPGIEAHYSVTVCGVTVSNDTKHLEISSDTAKVDELCEKLPYLPALEYIYLPKTTLSVAEISAVEDSVPNAYVDYSVVLFGEEYKRDSVTQLDFSLVSDGDLDSLIRVVEMIESLRNVTVMSDDGISTLSLESLGKLQQARPDVLFSYDFRLFGKTITTADETVEFVNYNGMGDKGLDKLRGILPYLTRCTYLKIDRCGTSNTAMAKLRDDYPNIKIVWRVTFGESHYNTLTDAQMLRCCGGIHSSDANILKYCTDVEYIDFGHNEGMSDISFVEYMPKLKVLIMVDCSTPTLQPLAKCKELRLLEIVNCWNLKNLEPLSQCTALEYLNMSNCQNVEGLAPLYNLPLKRLFLGVNKFSDEEKEELVKHLPDDCITTLSKPMVSTRVSYNYSIGWRLEEDGKTRTQWYANLRKLFRYDENYYSFGKDGIANGTLDG